MGKKDKKKQGRGEEKTRQKSEAKAAKRGKKQAAAKGEEDVESLIAEFVAKDKKRAAVHVETGCAQPSVRSSFSLTANPVKDELLLFGGEFFNGKQTFLYNDLFSYSFKRGGEWSLIRSPDAPPPRCSHQAAAVAQAGGQLWIFGGEFASPSQSQFYHYNDLWCLSLSDYHWTKHEGPGRPSPRSGHRMIVWKKLLIIFGGFHEVHDTFKYFNDVHAFSLETYQWLKLEIVGTPPSPRSGCQLVVNKQGKIVLFGGYSKSKVKKDVEKGVVHSDMFTLAPVEKAEASESDDASAPSKAPVKWKWTTLRQSGDRPSPRSGFSLLPFAPASGGGFGRALFFGGVRDEEEDDDDETLKSVFFNEMFTVDLENGKWFQLFLKGEKEEEGPKRSRRRKKSGGEGKEEEMVDEEEEEEEGAVKKLRIEEEEEEEVVGEREASSASQPQQFSDGIFTVSVGGAEGDAAAGPSAAAAARHKELLRSAAAFVPSERMNAQLVLRNNAAYLYGGSREDGDKTLTLRDFYSLDLNKLDTWRVIARDEAEENQWAEESESSEGEEEEEEGAEGGSEEEEEEEDFETFWAENRARFLEAATKELEESSGGEEVTRKTIKNRAAELARKEFEEG